MDKVKTIVKAVDETVRSDEFRVALRNFILVYMLLFGSMLYVVSR